jgi:hypothetical protein
LADVTYVSQVVVEPVEGRIRRAKLPAKEEPVYFGVHDEIAEHYGVSPGDEEPHPSTLDYLLVAPGDNPERLRSEASFASLCGVSPIEASPRVRSSGTGSTAAATGTPIARCT